MEKNEVVVRESGELVPLMMGTEQLLARKKAIQEVQSKVMTVDVDYGVIPGCAKPSLYKAGAEILNTTFGLRPVLNPQTDIVVRELGKGHKEYQVTVHILASGSDKEIATGVGSCSTMETKYHYRNAERICPQCGKPAIIKGSKEYGGGWVCWKKKEGCGVKFQEDDPSITDQEVGKIEYDNPADYYNTCLKMAKKRGLVDGTINATAVSHIFTQDVEDMEKEILRDAEFSPVKGEPTKAEPKPFKPAIHAVEPLKEQAEVPPDEEKTEPEVSQPTPAKKVPAERKKGKILQKSQLNFILKRLDGVMPTKVDTLLCLILKRTDATLENVSLDDGYKIITWLADPAHKGKIEELKKEAINGREAEE